MAIRLPRIIQAKQILRRSTSTSNAAISGSVDVPKGYLAIYVGESERKRFVIPIAYLNEPAFQDSLSQAEEEFGFDHPMGGLTIARREDMFIDITSRLGRTVS
ncbi:auxin-responsive protein SAUR24-like [Coffea eugenioides]|nr:auxin-responsive protein SAUR24-like [Coffea arabica]XP_027151759.1 auxin-responsive protein SAUR24-like [Coffea eugenioides]